MAVTRRSLVPGPPELKGAVISSSGVAADASQALTRPSAQQNLHFTPADSSHWCTGRGHSVASGTRMPEQHSCEAVHQTGPHRRGL